MTTSDTLLIGFDHRPFELDNTILIVGRKSKGEEIEIINAFQGEEAKELYQRLITKKE